MHLSHFARGVFAVAVLAPINRTATAAPVPPLGRVTGVVYDSLAMTNLAGALVWMRGSARSAIADKNGHFQIDSVPAGKQTIAFSSPVLDSLGLGTLASSVDVRADTVAQVTLATPSFRTVWSAICKGTATIATDSGIVWGTVRDAANDVRQANAATRFNWHDLRVGDDKKVVNEDVTRDVRSDSTGEYYACGLPVETEILTEAEGTRSSSGVVPFEIGARRLLRVDLLVSTDMVVPPSTKDRSPDELAALLKAHGTSTLRGTVRDDKGAPRANAAVGIASVDTAVITNANGEFLLAKLPAGTHVVEARVMNAVIAHALVDLRPGKETEITLVGTP